MTTSHSPLRAPNAPSYPGGNFTDTGGGNPRCTAFEPIEDMGVIRDTQQEALHV